MPVGRISIIWSTRRDSVS